MIDAWQAVEKTLARKSQGVEGKSGVRGSASYMIQPTHSGEPGITQEEILAITPILNHCGQLDDGHGHVRTPVLSLSEPHSV